MDTTANRASWRTIHRLLMGAAVLLVASLPCLIVLWIWRAEGTWLVAAVLVYVCLWGLALAARTLVSVHSPNTSDPQATLILRELSSLSATPHGGPTKSTRLGNLLNQLVDLDRNANDTLRSEIRAFFAYHRDLAGDLTRLVPQLSARNARSRAERQLAALAILYPHADRQDTLGAAREVIGQSSAEGVDAMAVLHDIEHPADHKFSRFLREHIAQSRAKSPPAA